MNLANRIQARTDNGDTVIDILIEVMQDLPRTRYGDERDGFKICHRLDAARLLTKYGCSCKSAVAERDEAIDFIIDNPPEPSRRRSDSGSSRDTLFDNALAKKIRESTDDGASVCRFLINVMEGELKAFGPQHRMTAARELLSRGFGKHAREEAATVSASRPSAIQAPIPAESASNAQTALEEAPVEVATDNHQRTKDDEGWAAFIEKVTPILEEDERRKADLAKQPPDPDNPPYVPDYSAAREAWENSEKWFYEWKNSLDPEEYEAIVAKELAEFHATIDTKIQRRKQISEDRERRAKAEAEREAQQAEAEAEAESEEPPEPGPPTRSQHKRKLMFVLGDSIYVDCDHPDCDLHEEDRSRFRGSVQYGAGPTTGHFP